MPAYSRQELIQFVSSDPHLTDLQKHEIINKLKDNDFYKNLIAGGTSLALLSKFTNLSNTSKVLLTVAGFGISKYLLDAVRKHDKFLQYNKKTKSYQFTD